MLRQAQPKADRIMLAVDANPLLHDPGEFTVRRQATRRSKWRSQGIAIRAPARLEYAGRGIRPVTPHDLLQSPATLHPGRDAGIHASGGTRGSRDAEVQRENGRPRENPTLRCHAVNLAPYPSGSSHELENTDQNSILHVSTDVQRSEEH